MSKARSAKAKKWLLILSIMMNIFFTGKLLFENFNSPNYKLGQLNKTIKVGIFGHDTTCFILPTGLTVRNVSERGISAIDQFENNRFDIVVTSDEDSLVNYNIDPDKLLPFGNYYSANKTGE